MDIINNYSSKFAEKLPEELQEKDIVGVEHVGDKTEHGGEIEKVSSLSQVQQPSLSEMFNMMTAMQRKIEAMHNVGGPMRGPKETLRSSPTPPELATHSTSSYAEYEVRSRSKRGPKFSQSHYKYNDHDMSSSEEDGEIGRDTDCLNSDYDQKLPAARANAEILKNQKRKAGKVQEEPQEKLQKTSDKEIMEFAAQYQQEEQTPGDNIEPWLADVINGMFTSPVKENVNKILKDIKMPGNLYLEVPRVNVEVWDNVLHHKKIQDV